MEALGAYEVAIINWLCVSWQSVFTDRERIYDLLETCACSDKICDVGFGFTVVACIFILNDATNARSVLESFNSRTSPPNSSPPRTNNSSTAAATDSWAPCSTTNKIFGASRHSVRRCADSSGCGSRTSSGRSPDGEGSDEDAVEHKVVWIRPLFLFHA